MLNKAIQHGKEYRKQYTGAKLCDRTCRNHGSCPQCRQNRTFSYTRENWWSKQEIEEYKWYSTKEANEYQQWNKHSNDNNWNLTPNK